MFTIHSHSKGSLIGLSDQNLQLTNNEHLITSFIRVFNQNLAFKHVNKYCSHNSLKYLYTIHLHYIVSINRMFNQRCHFNKQ